MNWVSLVGLYDEAALFLPDGGYLATYTTVGVIIVEFSNDANLCAQLNLFNGTRNFGAILLVVCVCV